MLTKHEQPSIIDLFENERRNREILISQLRLVILLGYVPVLYIIRFFTGYIDFHFIPLVISKWILICLAALFVYFVLNRGYYRSYIGYLTITLDLACITISCITLSFYKNMFTGAMNDPVFILYYLVGVSSVLRYGYGYVIYCILSGVAIMISLAAFDLHYFHIPLDLAILIDRIASFVFFTLMFITFDKRMKDFILRGYNLMERHLKVIDSILDIGKKIASQNELWRTLKNISIQAGELIQADACWIILYQYPPDSNKLDCISESDIPPSLSGAEIMAVIKKEGDLRGYAANPELKFKDQSVHELSGTPIKIGDEVVGAVFAAHLQKRPHSEYDHALLDMFAEHAAICIKNSRLLQQIKKETIYLYKQLDGLSSFEGMIGSSPRMREVFALIKKGAAADIPVLILGESGTGKELVAQALHKLSRRNQGPLIKINCAAIPSELLESELFGYERGAFTGANKSKKGRFELADGGTIFLDEIGDMDIGLQGKLLRVLQEQEFERVGSENTCKIDVRLITATNQNLEELLVKGSFREDLFYRINALPIHLPPLRERREDIPLLARHFIKNSCNGKQIEFTASAMDYLTHQEWKGNIRELENLIKRIIVISEKDIISEEDIRAINMHDDLQTSKDMISSIKSQIKIMVKNSCNISVEIERIEREFISEALSLSGGNMRKAASYLGIPKSTLFNKLNKYDIKFSSSQN